MTCPPAWLVCALVCALSGCTRLNPAFEGGLDGEGGASEGEVSTSSVTSPGSITSEASASATTGGSASSQTSGSSTSGSSTSEPATSEAPPTSSSGEATGETAMLVTEFGGLDQPLDETLAAALETPGFEVEIVADDVVTAAAAEGTSVVIISESADSAVLGGKLRDVPRPIVVIEGDVWSAMGMATASADQPGLGIFIAEPTHAIAAGLMGEVVVLVESSGSGLIIAAQVPPTTQVIARTDPGGPPVVFALDEGAQLFGRLVAPARRVGMGVDSDAVGIADGDLNEAGQLMFMAAVQWALS